MSEIEDYFKERLNRPDFKPESSYDVKAAIRHLETITAILLKDCGWEDDFCV